MLHVHAVRASSAGRRRLALLTAALAAAGLMAAVAASPALASGITCSVEPASVDYGQPVTVQGAVDPAAEGLPVTVSLNGTDVADGATDTSGAFSVPFTPTTGGAVTVRLADGATSSPATLVVRPVLNVSVLNIAFFASATLGVTVSPASYAGSISATAQRDGGPLAEVKVTAEGETTQVQVPIWGVGHFTAQVTLEAWGGLAGRSAAAEFTVTGRRIAAGSAGEQVTALLKALAGLHFRVPAISSHMSRNDTDAVVAFQKAYRLRRTYVFDDDDWRKLTVAKQLKPRRAKRALHIEVDKTRQILMVVKKGVPLGILAVCTGKYGNTPEGRFRIRRKALASGSPYPPGVVYWCMDFYPNFAIHAFASVPPHPASHGCVREPKWVAPWTYRQSRIGETVYVFH